MTDAASAKAPVSNGLLIVVAEADEATRNSLKFALEAEGCSVAVFRDAAALLAAPQSVVAGAYILDHHLPDMAGPTLLQTLREKGAKAPALFLAGRVSPVLRRSAEILCAPVLLKPLMGDALNVALNDLLARPDKNHAKP
ncbi:response regulator [Escherichia coli]